MLINTRLVQNRKHYACATHSSLPADRFHTEMGGRFALNDTYARFRTGVKFSPWCENRGEHFVVVSCKQIESHERELE